MMKHYDYIIVGSGLCGSIIAYRLIQSGKSVLVLEKRNHIGGNIYTENVEGINVHKYGAHIFHTSNKIVWDFINKFAEFNRYTNSPIANYNGEIYNLPFNMNTFSKLWNIKTPDEAKSIIESQRYLGEIHNLEEQALSLVGKDIYEKLINGYTEKQWGRKCSELSADIIKRLPLRFVYDNNYFNDLYQGIPAGGYTQIIEKLLDGADIELNVDYNKNQEYWNSLADNIFYTGALDEFFNYSLGKLEYRTVEFETTKLKIPNYQGNAVVNYTDSNTPYTRIIEHKHFESFGEDVYKNNITIISKEFSKEYEDGDEPFYK